MSIEEMVNRLKKIIPPENFREQPAYAIEKIKELENTYGIKTSEFLSGDPQVEIPEDDVFSWANEYENLLLFGGEEHAINPKEGGKQ